MTRVTVHKLNENGEEVWAYPASVIMQTASYITLEAYFDREDARVDLLLLRKGDRFVETFYFNRWYNVFAVYDAQNGRFKGWYCNISRPARISSGHIYAEDLALDLVVYPDGTWRMIDEAEYEELNLPPEERRQVEDAITNLKEMASSGDLPGIKDPTANHPKASHESTD
jgi:hypothetical protein